MFSQKSLYFQGWQNFTSKYLFCLSVIQLLWDRFISDVVDKIHFCFSWFQGWLSLLPSLFNCLYATTYGYWLNGICEKALNNRLTLCPCGLALVEHAEHMGRISYYTTLTSHCLEEVMPLLVETELQNNLNILSVQFSWYDYGRKLYRFTWRHCLVIDSGSLFCIFSKRQERHTEQEI